MSSFLGFESNVWVIILTIAMVTVTLRLIIQKESGCFSSFWLFLFIIHILSESFRDFMFWLIDHYTEIIQLSAPTSVVLFILSRWWEERKEFKRIKDVLFNEMAQNAKIIQENLDLIAKGKEGLTEGTHMHPFPLQTLSDSGWTLILASGKFNKLKGKITGEDIISAIRSMYSQINLINTTIVARAPILYGPLRTENVIVEGKKVSKADLELDIVDIMIEKNFFELKKKISKINKELL